VRETGAKGAMRVSVEDGRIVDVSPVAMDGARWAHLSIDVADISSDAELMSRIGAALGEAHTRGEGPPLPYGLR
jgi:hypothetical protein